MSGNDEALESGVRSGGPTDTERLDWLERQAKHDDWTRVYCDCDSGVELSSCNDTFRRYSSYPTVREAIDAAMREDGE